MTKGNYEQILKDALSKFNSSNFLEAKTEFMNVADLIAKKITELNSTLISMNAGTQTVKTREYVDMFRHLDLYTDICNQCGLCDRSLGYYYEATQQFLKAIINRIPFRYFSETPKPFVKELPEFSDIERPKELFKIFSVKSLIDYEKLMDIIGGNGKGFIVNNEVRRQKDLKWFVRSYVMLVSTVLKVRPDSRIASSTATNDPISALTDLMGEMANVNQQMSKIPSHL